MAISNKLLLYLIFTAFLLTTTAAAAPFPPSVPSNNSHLATVLSSLGFEELASATQNLSIFHTPATIFAPIASSLRTCPSCSIPLLLQEYSVPDIYEFKFLQTLAFGTTKIESFAVERCVTITTPEISSLAARKVLINGLEVNNPELYNDGHIAVYSLKEGPVYHPSRRSCFGGLFFPPYPESSTSIMARLLSDTIKKLRDSGYGIVAKAMQKRFHYLWSRYSMTLFVVDDESLIAGYYEWRLGSHIMTDRLLTARVLVSLSTGTVLPMWSDRSLVVTTGAEEGGPVRINYAKVKRFDMVNNEAIVVHGLSMPLRHVDYPMAIMGIQELSSATAPKFTATDFSLRTCHSCSISANATQDRNFCLIG